jgi:plastocyanin
MKRVGLLAIALGCLLAAAPIAHGGGAHAARAVTIGDNYFRPHTITLSKGATITWRWRGDNRHNVYFTSGLRSGRPRRCGARRSGSCTRRFRKSGRYGYVCTFHGSMTGRVVVRR